MNESINAEFELVPVESPQKEIMRTINESNPEMAIELLERRAALAPRFAAAINQILVSQTFPEDWKAFGNGDKKIVCLSSAGTERVMRFFPIRTFEVRSMKQEFEDKAGKGYQIVFTGYGEMNGRVAYAEGVYGTRDKFLGFANEAWKPLEEINENNIRRAAFHIFQSNLGKELLGLRGMPEAQWNEIMGKNGQNTSKAGAAVKFASGTQGGTSTDDHEKQKELGETCVYLANAGYTVEKNAEGKWACAHMSADDTRPELDRAKEICVKISAFNGKDGGEVAGLPASQLKGKRLDVTLETARRLRKWADG